MYDLQSTVYGLRGSRYEYCLQSAVCRQLFTACCLRLLNCGEERVEVKRYTSCAVDVAVCRLPKNGRHVCVERTKTGPHWGMGGGNWGFWGWWNGSGSGNGSAHSQRRRHMQLGRVKGEIFDSRSPGMFQ